MFSKPFCVFWCNVQGVYCVLYTQPTCLNWIPNQIITVWCSCWEETLSICALDSKTKFGVYLIPCRGQLLSSKSQKNINLHFILYSILFHDFIHFLFTFLLMPAEQLCTVLVKLSLGGQIANGIAWACYNSHFGRIYE